MREKNVTIRCYALDYVGTTKDVNYCITHSVVIPGPSTARLIKHEASIHIYCTNASFNTMHLALGVV